MCFDSVYNFLILSKFQPDIVINMKTSPCKVTVIIAAFYLKLNFLDRFSRKSSNIKFSQNSSSGSRVVPSGRTDRYDEANSRSSRRRLRTKTMQTVHHRPRAFRGSCCTALCLLESYNISERQISVRSFHSRILFSTTRVLISGT